MMVSSIDLVSISTEVHILFLLYVPLISKHKYLRVKWAKEKKEYNRYQ